MFRVYFSTSRSVLLRYKRSFHQTSSNADYVKVPRKDSRLSEDEDELTRYIFNGYAAAKGIRLVADKKRINIVSRKLCDDVIKRMKPSLLKHKGCDIIEVNPGAGVWSSAIHNLLQPRNHILMEPDHQLYQPLLQPLLDAEGSTYKLIPKSGAVWANMQKVLTPEMLPEQEEFKTGDPGLEQPNNTLLFIANLGWWPRKPYRAFPSISTLVVHQLLSAVRAHSLFQRYGLVRMLIWVADEEKKIIIPRTIGERKKMTIEAEISCHDIVEVASSASEGGKFKRDHYLNLQSSLATLKRMDEVGIETPRGREGPLQVEASNFAAVGRPDDAVHVDRDFWQELEQLERRYAAGEFKKNVASDSKMDGRPGRATFHSPEFKRMKKLESYLSTLEKKGRSSEKLKLELGKLQTKFASGELTQFTLPESELPGSTKRTASQNMTPQYKRLSVLRNRARAEIRKADKHSHIFEEYDAIMEMHKRVLKLEGAAAKVLQQEIDQRTAGFSEEVELLTSYDNDSFNHLFDNRRTFKNDPAILYWDRRQAEPLKVTPEEFYPRHEMCLLDFHPQPIWPVLRENFPANWDIFEYIVSSLLMLPTRSVRQGLTALAPGAFEWLVKECPSITDPHRGGSPNLDMLSVRCLTMEMYKEIIESWMKWPFRPSRYELMKRAGSVAYDPDEEAGDIK